jgi:hypothetical protein
MLWFEANTLRQKYGIWMVVSEPELSGHALIGTGSRIPGRLLVGGVN